jgi:hypothetical protein
VSNATIRLDWVARLAMQIRHKRVIHRAAITRGIK